MNRKKNLFSFKKGESLTQLLTERLAANKTIEMKREYKRSLGTNFENLLLADYDYRSKIDFFLRIAYDCQLQC